MNLTAYLIDSSRPCTAEEIRSKISGYGQENSESFRRMFERDKETLRELEIPLEVVKVETDSGTVDAYRIDGEKYRMPDPGLTPEEQAALMMAIERVRIEGALDYMGDMALTRLKLGIESVADNLETPLTMNINVESRHVVEFFAAVMERRVAKFKYRTYGGEVAQRSLQPMSLANVGGKWYVGGVDLDRNSVRIYRIDRVIDDVELGLPDAFEVTERPNIREQLSGGPWTFGLGEYEVRLAFKPEVVWRARATYGPDATFVETGARVVMTIKVAEPENLLPSLLDFGAEVEVLEPESLRSQLVEYLKALVG